MGELHLEIYVERIRREYKVEVEVGAPKVSYREAPTKRRIQLQAQEADRRFGPVRPHRRQDRCRCPTTPRRTTLIFEDKVIGGRIPKRIHSLGREGLPRFACTRARWPAIPIVGVKTVLEDGSYHDVDSSDMAFQICARNCFRETFLKTKPVLLEPVMKIEVEVPANFQGSVAGELTSRRGMIVATEMKGNVADDRGRGAAGRDVRLLDRPAQHDAGPGHLHDGVLQVSPRARQHPGRTSSPTRRSSNSSGRSRRLVPMSVCGQDRNRGAA